MTKKFESYEKDKNVIIQAFINFYGVDNSEYIIKKISSSDIIWYDSNFFMENDNIYNHIITSVPKEKIDKYIKMRTQDAFLQSAYIDEFDLLVLPQDYDLTQIIHEINHKIGSHPLSLEPYAIINGLSFNFERGAGIVQQNNEMNEIINQLMTLDIISELGNLGVNVEPTISWQEKCFPLIIPFYDAFKDKIKRLYIDGNIKQFINELGEEIYNQYSQFIFRKTFTIKRKMTKKEEIVISQEDVEIAKNFVQDMINMQNKGKNL